MLRDYSLPPTKGDEKKGRESEEKAERVLFNNSNHLPLQLLFNCVSLLLLMMLLWEIQDDIQWQREKAGGLVGRSVSKKSKSQFNHEHEHIVTSQ